MIVRIAAAAFPVEFHRDWAAYCAKITRWVNDAQADLLVFPEYGAMELASLGGADVAQDLERSLQFVAELRDEMDRLFEGLAKRAKCHILAPSGPVLEGGKRLNRASLFGPEGRIGHQDKVMMTRFEREDWRIDAGQGLRVFDTALGRIGVVICYDSEFPLLSRALCAAGVEILLVPSCTDALSGYARVKIGAMARALENQCVVVHAPTVDAAPWCPAVDENIGAAGIYGPPDRGWPETGVIAQMGMNETGWLRAQIDVSLVARSREDGAVLPFKHWPEQDQNTKNVTFT
ncbi:carbon-nitrogen hydrolase family protein [Albirhodobacter sp. R86504]|uniref:carbon-nitrogen hydrolase family protein n=1 Tax=Albirhodobacter sp. R86504 TaxID=3093848 RepID=UPI0036709A50